MNTRPLVSVIIPAYNCDRFIGGAVNSVLAQTYTNNEIIIIDDGSDDDTAQVLAGYGDRVRVFRQPNLGNSQARNEGFRRCNGKYIAFLDADDQWKPFKLELQVAILEKMPDIDLLFTNYDLIDENEQVQARSVMQKGFPIFEDYRFPVESFFSHQASLRELNINIPVGAGRTIHHGNVFEYLFRGNFVLPSTEIFRKKCLRPDLQFNEQYRCASDQDFHLRFARWHRFAFIDCSSVNYRSNRKGKLSGKKNTATLIRNTIQTREKIIAEEPSFVCQKRSLIQEVMGRNYARLAYFHLSELEKRQAAASCLRSLRYAPTWMRPWIILALTALPSPLLKAVRKLKQTGH